MKKLAILLAILLAVPVLATGPTTIKMAWAMDGSQYAHRGATLTAYKIGAADFEVPVRCSYNADLDAYVWAFKASIPSGYETGDWLLMGQDDGSVVAMTFTIQNAALGLLTWLSFPAPTVQTAWAEGHSVNFTEPAIDPSLIVRWELLRSGSVISTDTLIADGPPTVTTIYKLRAVLAGSAKAHYLYSAETTVAGATP
jgi:hypothetical protein